MDRDHFDFMIEVVSQSDCQQDAGLVPCPYIGQFLTLSYMTHGLIFFPHMSELSPWTMFSSADERLLLVLKTTWQLGALETLVR